MRHICAHGNHRLALRQSSRGEVQRVIPAEPTAASQSFQALEIADCCLGIDHRRQGGRVWRDYRLLTQSVAQAEARYPKAGVLVSQFAITRIECRLGNPPREVALGAILNLPPDGETCGIAEHAAVRLTHDETRHQIFEHGTGPRNKRGTAIDGSQHAAESEPVTYRQIALRNGEKAGETSLGSQ